MQSISHFPAILFKYIEAGQLTTHIYHSMSSITTVRADILNSINSCKIISDYVYDTVFFLLCTIKLNSSIDSRQKKVLKLNENKKKCVDRKLEMKIRLKKITAVQFNNISSGENISYSSKSIRDMNKLN